MSSDWVNDPESFNNLSTEDQNKLLRWIEQNLTKSERFNPKFDSYRLKHLMGFYCTNGQFKGAMLKAGYKVKDESALNWIFNISRHSPAIKRI